jgi:hypothetical protein
VEPDGDPKRQSSWRLSKLVVLRYAKQSPSEAREGRAKLIAEMRHDIAEHPLVREFILLSNRRISYNASYHQFMYFIDEHDYLQNIIVIMQNVGAIYDARFNDVPRYRFTEEFVSFLSGNV